MSTSGMVLLLMDKARPVLSPLSLFRCTARTRTCQGPALLPGLLCANAGAATARPSTAAAITCLFMVFSLSSVREHSQDRLQEQQAQRGLMRHKPPPPNP